MFKYHANIANCMAIKSIIAIGLAGLLGCSGQEEYKADYSNMVVSNSYEIEKNGCANIPNIGMVCYRGINENKEVVLEIISNETKQSAYKLSPAEQPLLDTEEFSIAFRMDYVSNSELDISVMQKNKKK